MSLGIVLALAGIAGLAALMVGFSGPLTVQDDARQFVFWMAEWRDESFFRGDLVAEYWRSVSPWLFTAVYRAFDLVGIEPLTTARILPIILFPATGFFAFRFARAISDDPRVAALGALLLLLGLVSDDGVVSATPRAFAPLFFLIFLDGLARRLTLQVAIGLFCLAGVYPHLAIVGTTVLGIVFVDFTNGPRLKFAKADLTLLAAGVVAAVAGVTPFLVESGQFGPTVTPETATQFATFGPGGRSSVFGPDGTIDFACGRRIGLFAGLPGCEGFASPVFWLAIAAVAAPPALVFVRYLRSNGRSGSPIPFAVVLAGFAWFAIAALVAFRLHLPNRFVVRAIPMMTQLCLGLLIGEFIRDRLAAGSAGARAKSRVAITVGIVVLAVFGALVATQTLRYFKTWKRPSLAEAIASLPVGTVIAGFVSDTDYVPLLAKRRVLFSIELAVGYHLGYFRQIEARMQDMVEAELTPDVTVLADRLARNAVDVYLVEAGRVADRQSDENFARILGDFVEQKRAELGDAPTALSRLAPPCRQGTFDGIEVLDARCLIAAAQR